MNMKLAAAAILLLACLGTGARAEGEILPVDNDAWLHECAQTFQTYSDLPAGKYDLARSNHYLIAEPSGLCADQLTCVFDECRGAEHLGCLLIGTDNVTAADPATYPDLQGQTFDGAMEACGVETPVALPDNISFPKTAADVVAAVEYAKEKGMQVSIKSTGHCYTGCHTKAGSLMINLRDYAKYATADSIVECDESNAGEAGDACVLALAKGMTAYIPVGGGQVWSDVYTSVLDAAEAGTTSKLYAAGGGGAGSVGAVGGWLQGGGLSTGYERMYGIGVDQILEFELVLPNGSHVKIFPSEWEDVEGYVYPQTKKVTAWCNANVSSDEAEWDWQPCTDEELSGVSPEDLWKALRGGGGGTYGVVLSTKYQLFEQKPLTGFTSGTIPTMAEEQAPISAKIAADETGELFLKLARMYTLFIVDLLFAPEKLGLSEDFSLHLGSPELDFRMTSPGAVFYWGDGDPLDTILPAWNQTVDSTDLGGDEELAETLKTSMFASFGESFKSYGDMAMKDGQATNPNYDDIFPPGVVPDAPLPLFVAGKGYDAFCSFNLPLALLQSSDEADRDLVFATLGSGTGGHVTGGLVAKTGDGMDAVPPSERVSGQSSLSIEPALATYGEDLLSGLLNAVYKSTDSDGDGASFPGYYEYNHICPGARVPSKADWTKECDSENEDDCFSIQEATWGSELYEELQAIKAAVDPDNMLDCYPCVQHPGVESATTPSPTASGSGKAVAAGALSGLALVLAAWMAI